MSIISLCGVAFICAIAVIILRENRAGSMSLIVSCFGVVFIVISSFFNLSTTIGDLNSLLSNIGNIGHSQTILKCFGVAFVVEFSSDIIRELGSDSAARSIEFAGKVEIVILCISPIRELVGYASSAAGQVL